MNKRFAGLPRWVWFVALAGGIAIGIILRYQNQGSPDETTDATQPDIGNVPDYGVSGGGSGPGTPYASFGDNTPVTIIQGEDQTPQEPQPRGTFEDLSWSVVPPSQRSSSTNRGDMFTVVPTVLKPSTRQISRSGDSFQVMR